MTRVQYTTEQERLDLIAQHQALGELLYATQNHLDGNYLIFLTQAEYDAIEAVEAEKQLPHLVIGMAKVLEAVLDLVVSKGYISISELPQEARDIIQKWKTIKSRL